MDLSVIIPSVGRPDVLEECLKAVGAQLLKPAEIIVVAQGHDVATHSVARRAGAAVAIVPGPGLAQAIQTGLQSTEARIACFTDDDAVPFQDWTQRIHQAFAANADVGIVCGRDNVDGRAPEPGDPSPHVGILMNGRVIGNHHLGTGAARLVDHPKGVNMALLAEPARLIPLASSVYGKGSQTGNELVLALALKKAGFRCLYDPSIQVDHFPARRLTGDDRTSGSHQKLYERAYNRSYAIYRYCSTRTAVVHLVRSLLVGDRINPGLLLAFYLSVRTRTPVFHKVPPTFDASTKAWKAARARGDLK